MICGKNFAQLDEGAHDSDVDLDGAVAVKDAGKHGDALLGECEWPLPQSHFGGGIGCHNL